MDKTVQDYALSLTRELKEILPQSYVPPSDGAKSKTEMVVANSLVKNTRGYIERVVMCALPAKVDTKKLTKTE